MKFHYFVSDMGKFGWKKIDANSFEDVVMYYFDNHIKVYDADVCGDTKNFFAVFDGNVTKYFRLDYSWYIEFEPEWQLRDDFSLTEIPKEETKGLIEFRDWIDVGSFNKSIFRRITE